MSTNFKCSPKNENAANELSNYFATYPDFPKKGINFWDVFVLFRNRKAFELLNVLLAEYAERCKNKVDVVVGIESRGFVIGPLLANLLNCSFVPARKKGKLPGEIVKISYTIEYGTDTLEIQKESIKKGDRVLVVDDTIATGGTMKAACDLIRMLDGIIVDCMVIYLIPGLNGKDAISESVTALCN